MPRLPNILIHLSGVIRPKLLRPDIKVSHIGYIDLPALRRQGFNAVVVDKDNCVTLPERDEVYPPFKSAWDDLLHHFPGRVLVVSNSAGTKKDPGGIAAESVSLNLRAPVLLHSTPKPGCGSEILAYFRGELGLPTTLRGQIHARNEQLMQIEKEDEKEMLGRWLDEADHAPLFAQEPERTGTIEQRQINKEKEVKDPAEGDAATEALKLLVIGDRLFTDTLLAHRLSRSLPRDSVISIHTTLHPLPDDVRLLRWIETKLSKGRLKEGKTDWSRFTRNPYALPTVEEIEAVPPVTWKDKIGDWKEDVKESRLQWDPRTWTVFDLTVGTGRVVKWVTVEFWRLLRRGSMWTYSQIKGRLKPQTPQTTLVAVEPINAPVRVETVKSS